MCLEEHYVRKLRAEERARRRLEHTLIKQTRVEGMHGQNQRDIILQVRICVAVGHHG